jgi:Thymidylate synthase
MLTLQVANVCQALACGTDLLLRVGERQESRAGSVLVAPTPVMTVYEHPTQRVLFHPARDANPFFHLAEALWMLAGREDAAFLNLFVRDFGGRFAEPDGRIHDAYGQRWRQAMGFDQLEAVISRLRSNPLDRQCVIQMWDAVGKDDLCGSWRGRPCNTHIYMRVRDQVLDLTVCCRSNDIIWGAYGANAVHFSILQEYLAAHIRVGVGRLYQLSNNYHAYTSELQRIAQRRGGNLLDDRYHTAGFQPQPLVGDPRTFDGEVAQVLSCAEKGEWTAITHNQFLAQTALPMVKAHACWRRGGAQEAMALAQGIAAPDWRTACAEWLGRRMR